MPTLLLIRILKVFTPQHVDYCHPRISGAPGRLHQLLLHLCDSCCTGCLKDICILFGRLIWYDHRASVRELHIPPWTHIFQDGFQVASEAGSTQPCHQTRTILLQRYFRFTSFVFLGGTAGTVLTLPVSGILLNNYPWEVKKMSIFFGTRI